MKKMNLQLFAGGHSVTVVADGNMSAASASSTSDVQENATVTLTLTPASTYEVASVDVLAGGVTIEQDGDTVSFTMGTSNVVIAVKSQKNNLYQIFENCYCQVNNGTVTKLQRNVSYEYGPGGNITGVNCTPTEISLSADLKAQLVASGIVAKLPEWKGAAPAAS